MNSDESYRWLPEQGFLRCNAAAPPSEMIFSGRSLLALQAERWEHPEDLSAAKRLMRYVLSQHLGNKPLKSQSICVKITSNE